MKLDDFASVFRSAIKERFQFTSPTLKSALVVSDLPGPKAAILAESARSLLSHAHGGAIEWKHIAGEMFENVAEVIALIEAQGPDLIVTHRHLLARSKRLAHSLGSTVDTLTQVATVPILLLPTPADDEDSVRLAPAERVLVVTDHLTGNDALVNWGVHLCPESGTLFLAHIEDRDTFERYISVIGKIPGLDTELADERIRQKLLDLPRDYVKTIANQLSAAGIHEKVIPIVGMGHAFIDYKRIVEESDIDLLVIDSKDSRQLAMHGIAYGLAIEIRHRPLLLL